MAKKKKLNVALIIAILALLINIITVSIYVYQAAIMREKQHASVWPHIEWVTSYIEGKGFSLTVTNNGVGPALIKNTTMHFNGEEVMNLDSLFSKSIGTTQFPHIYRVVRNRVLAPGEKIVLIEVEDSLWAEKLIYQLASRNNFSYEIIYESIYGQKWVSKGFKVEEIHD